MYKALNAYDTSYEGVRLADIVECNILFQYAALDFYHELQESSSPSFKFEK